MRHWIFREGISRQREEPVLCLDVEVFLLGGSVPWSPARERSGESGKGEGR